MSLYPSEVPLHEVCDVEFDEPLNQLMPKLDDYTYGKIERFWTSLYLYHCPPEVREVIGERLVEIDSIQIIPITYDFHEKSVRVLLQPIWFTSDDPEDAACTGYCMYLTVSADGSVWMEEGDKKMTYSDGMKPHISQLLATTALSMPPLESDSVYWRNETSHFNGDSF